MNLSTHDLDAFRKSAFLPERPFLIKADTGVDQHAAKGGRDVLPAASRWFISETATAPATLSPYLAQFSMALFPYEIMCAPRFSGSDGSGDALDSFCAWLDSSPGDGGLRPGLASLVRHHRSSSAADEQKPAPEQRLLQLHAPLALLFEALRYNQEAAAEPLTQLYIAQASLADLPAALREDVPTPHLVRLAGRGDIYDTSLWLGIEPTYTPWHRDPNPNLFCQLGSGKTVRLSPPAAGEQIFRQVQAELARNAASAAATVHARIRGEEMMQGLERRPLHDAVWTGTRATATSMPVVPASMQEAHVEPGDMLFIPKGWWHSVKSARADGRLNASVNWWFR